MRIVETRETAMEIGFMRTLLGCIWIAMAGLFVSVAEAEDAAWRIASRTGEVRITAGGLIPAALDPASPLPSGTVVTTGAVGRAVLNRGAEQIVVSPNSRLTLAGRGAVTRIAQDAGSVLFNIGKRSAPHFQVDTPYLVALVKGTSFVVSVDAEAATVRVTEGAVEVATLWRDAVTLLKPGASARVSRSIPDQIEVVRGGVTRIVMGVDGDQPSGGGLRLARGRASAGAAFEVPAAHVADLRTVSVDIDLEHAATVLPPDRGTAAVPVTTAVARASRGVVVSAVRVTDQVAQGAERRVNKIILQSRRGASPRAKKTSSEVPVFEVVLAGFALLGFVFCSQVIGARRRSRSTHAQRSN